MYSHKMIFGVSPPAFGTPSGHGLHTLRLHPVNGHSPALFLRYRLLPFSGFGGECSAGVTATNGYPRSGAPLVAKRIRERQIMSSKKEKSPQRTAFPAFASLCMTDQVIEVFTGGGSTRQQVPNGIRDNARENRKGEAYQHIAQTDHLLSGGSQKII